MSGTVRVLGIDTSLRSSGFGVVEARGTRLCLVECGNIHIPQAKPVSECLVRIGETLSEIIDRTSPHAAAVEGVFYCKNVRTAVTLGQARGVAIASCAGRNLPVYEYSPRRIKQAVVGFGAAGKEQVRGMVKTLLGLDRKPQEDAADALAIAICHLHNSTLHDVLMPKTI